MDLKALIEKMVRDRQFRTITGNPLAQFGRRGRNYLGATLLPERNVPDNEYMEDGIRYRTVIANSGDRYSPVQLKEGILYGSMRVSLGHSDIGSQISAAHYDALLRIIANAGNNPSMEAVSRILRWADTTLNLPLIELNEKQRWDAIVSASVVRTGDNGYTETVSYPNPSGHRVAAGGDWDSDAYDPYDDIIAGAELLASKGYTVNRIIASRSVISELGMNTKIQTRVGRLSIIGGTVVGLPGRASIAQINALFSEDGLPPIEEYNLQYRTQNGSGYFLPRNVLVMVATTGIDEDIDFGDSEEIPPVRDTLGYMGIGRAAGQTEPGRVIPPPRVITDSKPPRIEGEGWQTALPIITEPEAIYVITGVGTS
jgi:hypothetical protein